jgi:hypothetical protein
VSFLAWVDMAVGSHVFLATGIESPVLGNMNGYPELTFDTSDRLGAMALGAGLTSRLVGVPFVYGSAEVVLRDSFSLGVEGHYGQGNTLREWREHPLGPGAQVFAKPAF